MTQTYDYIIVGAGAGGCVVANRLSANPDLKILLLEAGGSDDKPEFNEPSKVVQTWAPEYDFGYVSEPVPGLNNRKIGLLRGKVLGGSTSVHAMLHVRGNRKDFDTWNYLGNEGWSYDDVLPYFIKSEDFDGGDSGYHGVGGPLSIRWNPALTIAAEAFLNAGVELGFDGPKWDYNGARQENSIAPYQLVITKDGKRASASVAFLRPIMNRPNLTVITEVKATRILIEKGTARGIEYVKGNKAEQVNAQQEVILCGGTYDTPKLLMLSGIGPAEQLKSHGIEVITDLPGIGQNMIDHVLLPLLYHSKKELPDPEFIAEAGLFTKTRSGMSAGACDLQVNFNAGVHAIAPPDIGHFFGFIIVLIQPQSKGYLALRSGNPADAPIIQPNYMACETDIQVLKEGIRLSRELAQTKALSEFSNGEINLGLEKKSEQELREFILNNCSTIWHPVGTCKMGRDPMAVVDPQLRVYGVKGLRIADASVMPTITAGNTAAATMMIGEKAADLILSE